MNTVITEKGQVTIPKPLREKLGLRAGTILEFEAVNGTLVGRKKIERDVFSKWRGRGRLSRNMSVSEYLKRSRDANGG